MFNLLTVIDFAPGAAEGAADRLVALLAERGPALPGVKSSAVGPTLPRALNGGQVLWRLAFGGEQLCWNAYASPAFHEAIMPALSPAQGAIVDWMAYDADHADVTRSQGKAGLWRCLCMAVEDGTPTARIRQFERDLLEMPGPVQSIRNWTLGAVVASGGRRRWTHVWEQEFVDVGGLEGEYMAHPVHWGLVDGWFDPECPQRIVDPMLIHAAMDITGAVIV
jgi:stress responsive alpha/beta barrel protein